MDKIFLPLDLLAKTWSMRLLSLYSSVIAVWLMFPKEWQELVLEFLGRQGLGAILLAALAILALARAYNQGIETPQVKKDEPPITGHGVL